MQGIVSFLSGTVANARPQRLDLVHLANWLYRVALKAILGLRPAKDKPSLSAVRAGELVGIQITDRSRAATYRVQVENPASVGRGVQSVSVDDQPIPGRLVTPRDNGQTQVVRVIFD